MIPRDSEPNVTFLRSPPVRWFFLAHSALHAQHTPLSLSSFLLPHFATTSLGIVLLYGKTPKKKTRKKNAAMIAWDKAILCGNADDLYLSVCLPAKRKRKTHTNTHSLGFYCHMIHEQCRGFYSGLLEDNLNQQFE